MVCKSCPKNIKHENVNKQQFSNNSNINVVSNINDCVVNTIELNINNASLVNYITNLNIPFIDKCIIENKYVVINTPFEIVLEIPICKFPSDFIEVSKDNKISIEKKTIVHIIKNSLKIPEIQISNNISFFSQHSKDLLICNVKEYILNKEKGDCECAKGFKKNIINIYECSKVNENKTIKIVVPQFKVQTISKLNYFLSIGKYFMPSNVTLLIPNYVRNWYQLQMWHQYMIDNNLINANLTPLDRQSNMTVSYKDGDSVKLFKSAGLMVAYQFVQYLKKTTELNKSRSSRPATGLINPEIILYGLCAIPNKCLNKCLL